MSRQFQFSMKRLLVSTCLLCMSLGCISWAIGGNGVASPIISLYLSTIFLAAAATNLVGRPLLGTVVVMLLWTAFMMVTAFKPPSWIILALRLTVLLVMALLGVIAVRRHLDKRRTSEMQNRK